TLLWWRLLTWIDKDAPAAHLPREIINCIMVGAYVLGMILFLMLPLGIWVAIPIYLVIFIGSFAAYLGMRHQKVGTKDLIDDLKNLRIFKAGDKKRVKETPGLVMLATKDGRVMQAPEDESPERQAYDVLQAMLTDPLRRRAERIELAPIEG